MKYAKALDDSRSHIWTLRLVILVLFVVIMALWNGWKTAPRELRVYVPPDLSNGATLRADDPLPANIYAFAVYLYQQLNRWETDGESEYGERIFTLDAYFTPAFRQQLLDDLGKKSRHGELHNRARALETVPGFGFTPERVQAMGNGVWQVDVYFRLREDVNELNVKDTIIRYPLRIVRYAVDSERNPWGLAFDVNPGERPYRVSQEELAGADVGDPGA